MIESEKLFDLAHIDENWGGAGDPIYRTVVGIFGPEAATLRDGLVVALHRGDQETARRLAHTLKGAAANVGARRLAACAAALESAPDVTRATALAILDSTLQATLAVISAGGPAGG